MANQHIEAVLTEVSKKISTLINKLQAEEATEPQPKKYIDEINSIIRSLDHLVEELE